MRRGGPEEKNAGEKSWSIKRSAVEREGLTISDTSAIEESTGDRNPGD